jgi:hypothetical protein
MPLRKFREIHTARPKGRSQLDRLLDPQNTAISLDTLARAAHVLGKRLVSEIRDAPPQRLRSKRLEQHGAKIAQGTAIRRRRSGV